MAIWNKHISNPVATPWLDWIIAGTKTYEGRLYKDDWVTMKVGDKIHFHSEDRDAICVITDLRRYQDFAHSFINLRNQLVPIANITTDAVVKLYSQYYNEENIKKYGVVAVGVKLIIIYHKLLLKNSQRPIIY